MAVIPSHAPPPVKGSPEPTSGGGAGRLGGLGEEPTSSGGSIFVLVKPHEIVAPGRAVKVTLDAVDEVGVTPEHEVNVETQPS